MGVDCVILIIVVDDVYQDIELLVVVKLLVKVVEEEQLQMVLCGKQVIDNDMNVIGQMLLVLFGWS